MTTSRKIRWRSIAPVLPIYRDEEMVLGEGFDFGRGVFLGPAEKWPVSAKEAERHLLGTPDRLDFQQREFAFAAEYENGTEIDPEWLRADPKRRKRRYETARFRIYYANLALWLTRITPLSVKYIFHQSEPEAGSGFVPSLVPDLFYPLLCSPAEAECHLQPGDLESAKTRFQNLYALGPEGTVATVVRLLLQTLSDPEPISRFAGLWICIEGLVGPIETNETTHRLTERLALFLYGQTDEGFTAYRQLKKDYGLRSKVIHGLRTTEKHEAEFPDSLTRTEGWIRLPLIKIADDPALASKFNGEGRDDFLERLSFTRSEFLSSPSP